MKHLLLNAFAFALLCSLMACGQVVSWYLGVGQPKLESIPKTLAFLQKEKINANTVYANAKEVEKVFLRGNFPIIYILDKNGKQIDKPNCFEVIGRSMYELADSVDMLIGDTLLGEKLNAVGFTDAKQQPVTFNFSEQDYLVLFYWSVWLGTYNSKKLHEAQTAIDAINKEGKVKIKLQPINFDVLEEWGFTEAELEVFWENISKNSEAQKAKEQK